MAVRVGGLDADYCGHGAYSEHSRRLDSLTGTPTKGDLSLAVIFSRLCRNPCARNLHPERYGSVLLHWPLYARLRMLALQRQVDVLQLGSQA